MIINPINGFGRKNSARGYNQPGLNRTTAEEIMAPNPITVEEDATVGEAAQERFEYKISGPPVVNPAGGLVGIITESDIFCTVVQEWSTRKQGAIRLPRKSE